MNFSEFLQPAIFALTGKPGAGKSYFATRCIIAEITKGNNRTIVTNVPINREKLRAYVKKDFHLYDLETFTDNRFFFTNRGHYNIQIENTADNVDFGELLQDDDDGVLFIIDEAHLYFNARNWKHMQGATLSYITFIRHIGDTCIYMCQKFSDIDSQFRGKTQAFHYLRNLAKERYGWFKRGDGFRCYQYLEESHIQNHGSSTDNAVQDFSYPFKLDVAECYNTSLFNKAHDKKYKVKGIPLKYVFYFASIAVIAILIWIYNGGLRNTFNAAIPDMVKVQTDEVSTTASAMENTPGNYSTDQYVSLPPPDPLIFTEVPKYTFADQASQITNEPFSSFTEDQLIKRKKYWLGESIKTKISFFSDKDSSDNKKGFGFQFYWQKFREFNSASIYLENGLYEMQTPFFKGFATYVKDSGIGVALKDTEVILKENVPFTLKHGFQLPYEQSYSTQGVIRSSRSYQQVGFELTLVYEMIDDLRLLRIEVENSDVLDISATSPILQTFSAQNVLDVQKGITYLIADFNSQTKQKQSGFLKSSNYESTINNKIFLSFGQTDI